MVATLLPALEELSLDRDAFPLLRDGRETVQLHGTSWPCGIVLDDGSAPSLFQGGVVTRREIDEIAAAMRDFMDAQHQLIEGAAGVAVAALNRAGDALAGQAGARLEFDHKHLLVHFEQAVGAPGRLAIADGDTQSVGPGLRRLGPDECGWRRVASGHSQLHALTP